MRGLPLAIAALALCVAVIVAVRRAKAQDHAVTPPPAAAVKASSVR